MLEDTSGSVPTTAAAGNNNGVGGSPAFGSANCTVAPAGLLQRAVLV
jgi:hypothetical protein